MNSTTTYKRTMFGLSEINADIINCNDLTLSGSLKTNLITSTAAGQSLSVDALGTGSLVLKSGSTTKLSISNTETSIESNNLLIKDGKSVIINNVANTANFSIGFGGSNVIFNMTNINNYFFRIAGVEKFRISAASLTAFVYITAPTEVVGSNNTRLATTAFVTTATLGLTGITYTDLASIDMTIIDNNVTISTGKTLSITNFPNVSSTLTTLSTSLTGITYSNAGSIDMTTIDNNLTIPVGKIFSLGTIADVETELIKLTGVDYLPDDNATYFANNVIIDNTLSIPSYPNVSSTLDTLTIAAQTITGISYNAGTDTTTISNNLTIGTGKIVTSDEMWCKLYSTHDLTDTIGVGYFKSFFYNSGSIGYISTQNPVDIYDGTGSEIRIKVSTQEIGFNIDGMCLYNSAITLCDDIELPAYSSLVGTLDSLTECTTGVTYLTTLDKTSISNNLEVGTGKVLSIPSYPDVESTLTSLTNSVTSLTNSINSLTIKKYEDDFLDGFNTCPIPWTSTGTGVVAVTTDEPGHVGNVRMVASNDRILYPTSTNIRFYWEYFVKMEFCIKTQIVIGNPNHDYIVGLSDNNGMSNDTILWSYTAAAGQWEMIVNGFAYQNAPGVSLNDGDYFYGFIESKPLLGTKFVRFYLKNLNTNEERDWTTSSAITDIDLAATYRPFFRVTNTDGVGTKSMFIDYVSIQHLKY